MGSTKPNPTHITIPKPPKRKGSTSDELSTHIDNTPDHEKTFVLVPKTQPSITTESPVPRTEQLKSGTKTRNRTASLPPLRIQEGMDRKAAIKQHVISSKEEGSSTTVQPPKVPPKMNERYREMDYSTFRFIVGYFNEFKEQLAEVNRRLTNLERLVTHISTSHPKGKNREEGSSISPMSIVVISQEAMSQYFSNLSDEDDEEGSKDDEEV